MGCREYLRLTHRPLSRHSADRGGSSILRVIRWSSDRGNIPVPLQARLRAGQSFTPVLRRQSPSEPRSSDGCYRMVAKVSEHLGYENRSRGQAAKLGKSGFQTLWTSRRCCRADWCRKSRPGPNPTCFPPALLAPYDAMSASVRSPSVGGRASVRCQRIRGRQMARRHLPGQDLLGCT